MLNNDFLFSSAEISSGRWCGPNPVSPEQNGKENKKGSQMTVFLSFCHLIDPAVDLLPHEQGAYLQFFIKSLFNNIPVC